MLPGHASIELCRGGRDMSVTIHNLHQYINLVTYWFLIEGVQKQFEALREGKSDGSKGEFLSALLTVLISFPFPI